MWVAEVVVTYKSGILDSEGKTIRNALDSLGVQEIKKVETGKYFQLCFDNEMSHDKMKELTEKACEKLLANPVMQKYSVQLKEVS